MDSTWHARAGTAAFCPFLATATIQREQPPPESIRQHEGRGTTSLREGMPTNIQIDDCDCSKGLGQVFSTWLLLSSHLEQLLFAQGFSCASHEHSCGFWLHVPWKGSALGVEGGTESRRREDSRRRQQPQGLPQFEAQLGPGATARHTERPQGAAAGQPLVLFKGCFQGLLLWEGLAPPMLPDPKCCQSSSSRRRLKCAQKPISGFVVTLQKRGHITRGWSSF